MAKAENARKNAVVSFRVSGICSTTFQKKICSTSLVKPGSNDYLLRILFDTTFYVWTGILLLNVVTGLMVDTGLSAKRKSAEQIKENSALSVVLIDLGTKIWPDKQFFSAACRCEFGDMLFGSTFSFVLK